MFVVQNAVFVETTKPNDHTNSRPVPLLPKQTNMVT
ncbi:uncharacterized protein G2W53_038931 [Senna tora]|uniref:Uncharacterized protein n=1 Tax=Senna tora TaxID=362788 RepID=A0A834SLN3_9FABA|nr:uncharacterized protein G2W53_038931 [Senna tora]